MNQADIIRGRLAEYGGLIVMITGKGNKESCFAGVVISDPIGNKNGLFSEEWNLRFNLLPADYAINISASSDLDFIERVIVAVSAGVAAYAGGSPMESDIIFAVEAALSARQHFIKNTQSGK